MVNISGSVDDLADAVWGSADDIAPSGSMGDLIGGVLKIPGNLLYGLYELFYEFGS